MHFAFGISEHFTGTSVVAAVFGGLLLGVTTVFKTAVVGEVLGVSCSTRGMFVKPSIEKAAFIVGLVVAGIVTSQTLGCMEPLPPPPAPLTAIHEAIADLSVRIFVRLGVGGFLVGYGTALGNGCTSGHGITGLARLSLRSWVAVPIAMIFAMFTATVSGTADVFPANPKYERHAPKWKDHFAWSAVTMSVLAAIALFAMAAGARLAPESTARAKVAGEFFAGLAFGVGLAVSTLARPSKVAGFLDWRSGAWDPSLAFVFASALFVTLPFWQYLERRGPAPPFLGGAPPPKRRPLDLDLVIGAMLFGVGWGVCGVCPGPIWVLVGAVPTKESVTVLSGLLVGVGAWRLQKLIGAAVCPAEVAPGGEVAPNTAPEDDEAADDEEACADVAANA